MLEILVHYSTTVGGTQLSEIEAWVLPLVSSSDARMLLRTERLPLAFIH